jgi:hypothetical protein
MPCLECFEEYVGVRGGDGIGDGRGYQEYLSGKRLCGIEDNISHPLYFPTTDPIARPLHPSESRLTFYLLPPYNADDAPNGDDLLHSSPIYDESIAVEVIAHVKKAIKPVAEDGQDRQAEEYSQTKKERG